MTEDQTRIITEAREKALVQLKKYSRPRFISAIIEASISIIAMFGMNWVSMGLNIDALKDPVFWIRTGLMTIGIYALYRAVVNARHDKTAARPSVEEKRTEYIELSNKKETDLQDYLKEFNLRTKTTVYVDKVNEKIFKLEKKLAKTYKEKKILKLEKRLKELRLTISQEYILNNIDKMHINYYMVFYSDFETIDASIKGGKITTKANYNKAFNKASFNKIWMYILSSAILGMSVWQGNDGNWVNACVNVIMTSMMVVTRIVSALYEADVIYDSTITKSYIDRTSILKEYFAWKENHPSITEYEKAKQIGFEKGLQQGYIQAKGEFDVKLDGVQNKYEEIIKNMQRIS